MAAYIILIKTILKVPKILSRGDKESLCKHEQKQPK
jgi:hypothetical protein